VVLDLDLPEGEGRKTALGEAPRNRCRPASALCPDMARGENQMSTSTDNNALYVDLDLRHAMYFLGIGAVASCAAFW